MKQMKTYRFTLFYNMALFDSRVEDKTLKLLIELGKGLDNEQEDLVFKENPTQQSVQKFLRNYYDCYVTVTEEPFIDGINHLVQIFFFDRNNGDWSDLSTGQYGDNAEFDSYEEALEFGLQKAIEIILMEKINRICK